MEKKLNNNEIINTTSLARLSGNFINSKGDIEYEEFNCNRIIYYCYYITYFNLCFNMSEQGLPYSDMYIYKVNNALSNGINGDLVSCGLTKPSFWSDKDKTAVMGETIPIPCGSDFHSL